MLLYTYYIISLRMLIHIVNYCIREKIHKLEKLVSDPYLLYLANKNMLKLSLFPPFVLAMIYREVVYERRKRFLFKNFKYSL